ncbi:TraB domain-containing protein [Thermococcus waiotapuensis]|uniref:TraB/GumN family protein n=1 Tax=Thermococcus waiotapuensis TaxID=90909 RepID=A0AAE4NVH3_9EURY|nr:TraB/GumN family protein [Thermococcus waiotapuensis]MDV3104320.1 TraB/GumN family protein [Thermococcus waiotapuensis]
MNYLRYVKVIGTMHVSPLSREEVVSAIKKERPTAVAVELDPLRLHSLLSGERADFVTSLKLGRGGLVGYLLTKFEEILGREFGMEPGGEMIAAVKAAREMGIPLYLIDEDIRTILTKILAAPRREKLLLLLEGFSVFLPRVDGAETLASPMEDYRWMTLEFRRRYPYLYRVLVEERNAIMARNLVSIVRNLLAVTRKPKVVAVVGLGHREGIERLLNSAFD